MTDPAFYQVENGAVKIPLLDDTSVFKILKKTTGNSTSLVYETLHNVATNADYGAVPVGKKLLILGMKVEDSGGVNQQAQFGYSDATDSGTGFTVLYDEIVDGPTDTNINNGFIPTFASIPANKYPTNAANSSVTGRNIITTLYAIEVAA